MDSTLLLNLIQTNKIKDQSELLDLIRLEGYDVTQSTLSRQLKRLGITKVDGFYKKNPLKTTSTSPILDIINSPPNLLLIKTLPGNAGAVAFNLEQYDFSEIAGTIAGDDTIMVAVTGPSSLEPLKEKIKKSFG
ncbi:MAG: arginine repressor [Alphaproteobacteria bacterium]|jgi:transcriptional regulator of arginine metabolism|nr:arginine repressor [Alphaproteobacteria bacterium]